MMKSANTCLVIFFVCLCDFLFSQGSWNPTGFDPSFPRIFPDSLQVSVVRNSITDPDHQDLYNYIWWSATNVIPPGNSSNSDRFGRALIAKEAAFVFLMDRKPVGNTIVSLEPADRDTMLHRAINLMETMNTEVDVGTSWTFYNPWQNRSKELIGYLTAYDLLKGSGISATQLAVSKTKLLTFAANLYQKAMASYTILNLHFFTYQFNNHSIMTASALGLAAVVFNDYQSSNTNYQPLNWINAGLYNLDNTLWMENGSYPRVSEPDTLAGYAEGPNYFKYGFENAFPFISAMGNFLPDGYYSVTFSSTVRTIRNPWFDPRYDRLYDWMNKIRMPDGSSPSIHDSYLGFGTTIMALSGKPWFNWLNPVFNANDPMVRTQYIATNVAHGAIADSPFQALPAAGSLVFRSSWQTSALYMHFIGKHGIALTGAKSHHQGDASSFSLSAYGELLAVDPGYPGSSQASLENKAIDHSLILVNGAGPQPPSGELVSTSTNTAYIENYFDTPVLDYGEVRVNYSGVEIIRKNLFIRNQYFLLHDFMSSPSAKNYTFQLHGNGLAGSLPASATGSFTPDFTQNRGMYQRSNVSLLSVVNTPGTNPSFSFEADSMVINSGFRKYSKMLALKTSSTNTLFQTILYPYQNSAPSISNGIRHSQTCSMKVGVNGFRDLVFSSCGGINETVPPDSSGMMKQVSGNGKINFYSETVSGKFASVFIQAGDSLTAGTLLIVKTAQKSDVAWMFPDSVVAYGYSSGATTLMLHAEYPLQVLSGAVQSITWNPALQFITITLAAKGNFCLGRCDLTWIWTGIQSTSWSDPANWNLQDHETIHGVPQETNNVLIPGNCIRMPEIPQGVTAVCHDLTIGQNGQVTVGEMRTLMVTGNVLLTP